MLRIQFDDSTLKRFKHRAAQRVSDPGVYADMVFHYLMRETVPPAAVGNTPGQEPEIYFLVDIPAATKRRLTELSEHRQVNLAAYTGLLIGFYFRQFERDPRDFSLIHYLSSLLQEKAVLAETDLRIALSHLHVGPETTSAPGYLERWLFSRLKPLVNSIEKDGQTRTLTVHLVTELIQPR